MKKEFMISCIGILALISCLLLAAAIPIGVQHTDFSKLTGSYLGQKPPGKIPEIFAPGIISSTGFVVFKGALLIGICFSAPRETLSLEVQN